MIDDFKVYVWDFIKYAAVPIIFVLLLFGFLMWFVYDPHLCEWECVRHGGLFRAWRNADGTR